MDPSKKILALSSIQALTDVFEDKSIKDKIDEDQIIIYFRKLIKLISVVKIIEFFECLETIMI